MKPKLLSVLVAALFAPALAQAQEEPQKEWSGSVSLGVRSVGISANDPSKFNEYRDLESGANPFAGFELRRRGDNDYLNAYGENIGRDDQYLDLSGGRYGTYKFRLYHDQLRHNFGSGAGAKTPYGTVGSDVLTGTLPNLNPAGWSTFDHSYKRQNFGGFMEWQKASPWYFRADANEVKREGINVFAGAKGTSPGNGFMDLPAPVDYTTQNVSGEVGYSTRRAHFAVNLMQSSFDNGHHLLRWQNDFFNNGLDSTLLPPDNRMTRLAMNGNIRGLGLDSTLAGRYTYTSLTSETTMLPTMLSTGGANVATNPSDPTFKGDHKRQTLGLSLASRPARSLDTRVFFNYDQLKNNSSEITFTAPGLTGGSTSPIVNCSTTNPVCTPELFHYTKRNLGVEGGYRLAPEHKLLAGADFTRTTRERADFPKTREQRYFGEYKAGFTDTLSGRFKYQFQKRRSDFEADDSSLADNPMDLYVRRFDLANSNQHLVKLVLDQNLPNLVDLGFEAILKRTNYPDTPLGRTKDQRQEYYGSFGWGDPKQLRVLVFGDIEYVQYDSSHRVGTGNPDPASGSTNTTYNWSAKNKDTSWQIGTGLDWAARPRLKVKTSLLYTETNGRADFASQQTGAPLASTLPITNFDNTRRVSFVMRGTYEATKQLEVAGGYSYEHYRYSDIGYDNTKYVAGTGTAASYTTGQFAFQPYSANIVSATAKYKF